MVQPLWKRTPLMYSQVLSESLNCNVYLKLEVMFFEKKCQNLQTSQSFKYRGMSLVAQLAKEKFENPHLIVASGGNAGYAAACAANDINAKCTVFLPLGLHHSFLDALRRESASIVIGGREYSEALAKAREAVAADPNSVELSAYDDKDLWEGHASVVHEISQDLNIKPDAILCSVGGGGLITGVMVGCRQVNWDDVPIVALETTGADCFYYSIQANRHVNAPELVQPPLREGISLFKDEKSNVQLAKLPTITSVATSLGALSPAPTAVKMALERKGGVRCVLIPDGLSMEAALNFADDHKFLVELACSTTLAAAYKPAIFDAVFPPKPSDDKRRTVVFIVCGGSKISLLDLAKYRRAIDQQVSPWEVWIEGEKREIQRQSITS